MVEAEGVGDVDGGADVAYAIGRDVHAGAGEEALVLRDRVTLEAGTQFVSDEDGRQPSGGHDANGGLVDEPSQDRTDHPDRPPDRVETATSLCTETTPHLGKIIFKALAESAVAAPLPQQNLPWRGTQRSSGASCFISTCSHSRSRFMNAGLGRVIDRLERTNFSASSRVQPFLYIS